MISFSSPVPPAPHSPFGVGGFKEALASLQSKGLLPTSLSSDQLANLPAEIRARSIFSARTTNAGYLQRIKDLTDQLLHPGFVRDVGADHRIGDLRPAQPGEYMDPATMRLKLKEALREISYDPIQEDVVPGTLKDLSSDARLNLIIQMQSDSAWGYGAFIRGQDPAALSAAPAQELFRAEARKEPRNWPQRWMNAGGQFYGGGRMIALKNDPIWTDISEFDQPYPPFDYGSGMWVRDIFRPEAIAFGLVDAASSRIPIPAKISSFNDGFESSLDFLDPDLQKSLIDSMHGAVEFIAGVLHLSTSGGKS